MSGTQTFRVCRMPPTFADAAVRQSPEGAAECIPRERIQTEPSPPRRREHRAKTRRSGEGALRATVAHPGA
jgi:hypothetical protein